MLLLSAFVRGLSLFFHLENYFPDFFHPLNLSQGTILGHLLFFPDDHSCQRQYNLFEFVEHMEIQGGSLFCIQYPY